MRINLLRVVLFHAENDLCRYDALWMWEVSKLSWSSNYTIDFFETSELEIWCDTQLCRVLVHMSAASVRHVWSKRSRSHLRYNRFLLAILLHNLHDNRWASYSNLRRCSIAYILGDSRLIDTQRTQATFKHQQGYSPTVHEHTNQALEDAHSSFHLQQCRQRLFSIPAHPKLTTFLSNRGELYSS